MAIIKCGNCGRDASDRAERCMFCKAPISAGSKAASISGNAAANSSAPQQRTGSGNTGNIDFELFEYIPIDDDGDGGRQPKKSPVTAVLVTLIICVSVVGFGVYALSVLRDSNDGQQISGQQRFDSEAEIPLASSMEERDVRSTDDRANSADNGANNSEDSGTSNNAGDGADDNTDDETFAGDADEADINSEMAADSDGGITQNPPGAPDPMDVSKPVPEPESGVDPNAAVYMAYYEVLMAAINEHGIAGEDGSYNDAMGTWSGISNAALVDFDDDGLPELVFTVENQGFFAEFFVYGYSGNPELLFSGSVGGDIGGGWMRFTRSRYGQLYLYHTKGSGAQNLNSIVINENYYTVDSGSWVTALTTTYTHDFDTGLNDRWTVNGLSVNEQEYNNAPFSQLGLTDDGRDEVFETIMITDRPDPSPIYALAGELQSYS